MTVPAGWKDDPEHSDQYRYWDGESWTEHRAPKRKVATPDQPPPPPPPVEVAATPGALWILLAGAGVGVVGAFLPWVSAGPFTVNGIDGDGQITVILAVLLGVIGFVVNKSADKRLSTGGRVGGIVLSLGIALIGAYDISEVSSEVNDLFLPVSVGFGLYLTVLAGVLGLVGTIGLKQRASDAGDQ
ncbi:DUF2510 domain-containing protein [Ilumatobacter coccineus]|uniref:DUF2510 domain-containing protein n=1 Tax=Ilumatobacter coccineus (strain NBRC 103263 / KCTC 29153 / YM16-304) TaxID=1313172 RepID=A0A6C7E801_ILUCY|nr:DUF2510 domain-containing protein [Ilumatobacter coccineus]BAN02601.1 hypothetical protein YM304_22870 [Ilumatobacter coccineus YM16-304]